MTFTEPTLPPDPIDPSAPAPFRRRRPWYRVALHLVRRGHLYCGLFLLPWVVLYGVTAFLFNHPTAFSDQPAAAFGPAALAGTPMEAAPPPAVVAADVAAALQKRASAGATYSVVEPAAARYTREFAFATVKADGQEVSVLVNANGTGGTVRGRPAPAPKPAVEPAPFAVGRPPTGGPGGRGSGGRGGRPPGGGDRPARPADDALAVDNPLHERVKAAVPTVLERTGFPGGEVTVTSVPDLAFKMTDGSRIWDVTYNAQAGTVSGKPAEVAAEAEPLSARRFLTRLHLAHGYPGEVNAKWAWAVVVDAMAFVMVFWALSGLFMWWQLKATRRAGAVVLVLSAAAAVWVGLGMHELISIAGR